MIRKPLALPLLVALLLLSGSAGAEDSALVRLLKSGRIPEERQPQIVAKIGQLGSAADLGFLLDRAVDPKGFAPTVRAKAIDALAEAAITRKGIKPEGDLERVGGLLEGDATTRRSAIRLIGLWKVAALTDQLSKIANDPKSDEESRSAAIASLALLGPAGEKVIRALASPERPKFVRAHAVAALAGIDPKDAATKAATLIREAGPGDDLAPLIASIVDYKDGAATLAKAIEAENISVDNAKLSLRALYAIGRADAALVAVLSKAAGIENETKPPTTEEMDALVAEVNAKGNAARGERVLRRADLNCMKCHAISGAAGGVGPDLSSVGLSSPVDYVINSILLPDQAIKEQYHTLVVATTDGQLLQGIVVDKDESKVVLKQATGELRTIPTSEIDETKEGGSLMPKGLANLVTHDEFVDLVRFISELGKPGPYAIRDAPTIQRWRLMSPVPEDLARDIPDAGAFVAKVRDSDPSAWVAAYGLATGEIPIDEFSRLAKSNILYLRGEIEVSAGGELTVDKGSHHGVIGWLDDEPFGHPGRQFAWKVTPGKHTITLRVDPSESKFAGAKVTIAKAPGSSAEFVVVGGR